MAEIVTDALVGTTLAAWLVTDPADRRSVIFAWSRSLVEHAVDHDTVYLCDDESAAAVWLHHHLGGSSCVEDREQLDAICGPHVHRFLTLDRLFDLHHPTEPHHHLRFLAARPDMRYLGRGNALLTHHHRLLDASGLPGYFEVNDTLAWDSYAHHGYRPGSPFGDPGGPQFWPMWRAPRLPRAR
ncbi:GNAT family N-acetyltransferase [Virgisporangium ochraceum]|uniref:N-acetyltransferase n=1 Tax=Virgisporangium ochraceum TaxID=65505 RepID=A0A8J3ZS10_9ACTN|nr:N-acetyltransferase [Virgisporangium ochraceum]GIJ67972.1 N-acetyltransferase [Virgisporangium ochraceum]